ncbi:hypothetical protein [Bacillus cereus]|uniref:hypothetical protein n=1 Tax=Bacillus cereus TaxID=1396 RepID=UPI00027ABBCA|nr:hypothetical protein [Bacillus cereus]EJS74568.1 hypothetical protein ICY_03471 [Bacillus cereus BAG2X1-3]
MNVGLLKNMISDFWGAIFILFLFLLLVSAYIFREKCKPSFIIGSAGQQNEQKKVFDNTPEIGDELKEWLETEYKNLTGVLGIWQKKAWTYKWLHYFIISWVTIIPMIIPFLLGYVQHNNYAMLLVKVASLLSAVLLGIHSTFKIQDNYKKYRLFESQVYDLVRRMKADPASFGDTDSQRRIGFFEAIQRVRDEGRNAEIDNIPNSTPNSTFNAPSNKELKG